MKIIITSLLRGTGLELAGTTRVVPADAPSPWCVFSENKFSLPEADSDRLPLRWFPVEPAPLVQQNFATQISTFGGARGRHRATAPAPVSTPERHGDQIGTCDLSNRPLKSNLLFRILWLSSLISKSPTHDKSVGNKEIQNYCLEWVSNLIFAKK